MTIPTQQRRQFRVWLVLAGLVAGCEGSGQTGLGYRAGIFSDAPVAGLAYATESQSGITDADGRYRFRDGETVRFSLGSVILGEPAPATGRLTPLDIVPGATAFRSVPEVRAAIDRQDPSFFTLTNILVFLQTFDSDGDPDRITIADGVSALLADARFDFAVEPAAFQQNETLLYFAWRAARAGLIPTASPRKPGAALDHFYAAQNLPHSFQVPQLITGDYDDDGVIEVASEILLERRGTISTLTARERIGGALQVSALELWTVNANGDVVSHTSDDFHDTMPPSVWSAVYDALGMATVITAATDSGINSTTMVARDAEGNETLRVDQNSDGFIDTIIERRFDRGGRLALETRDLNADGTPDSTRTLTYDSAGVLVMVRMVADVDADGDLDSIRETLHDGRGNPTTSNIDNDGDGDIDQVDSWTYDATGRLLLHTSSNPVTDQSLLVRRLEYDDAGRITYHESTSDFTHSWTYDDSGVLRESVSECLDCLVPSVTTTHYSYDAAQRRTTLESETWLAGNYADRSLMIYEYDNTGALTRWLTDDGADGSYELRVDYVNQPGDWSSVLDTRIDQPPSFTLPAYYED